MADTRSCVQCGVVFEPRREHVRFCSCECRTAWNRANDTDPAAEESALEWSVTAMREVTARLPNCTVQDQPQGFAVIGEAVWWVTIVDATMVRHNPDLYDAVLASYRPGERRRIEGTLGGLRFVRNWMGVDVHGADFIQAAVDHPGERVSGWSWRSMPEPDFSSMPPRGREWAHSRYQAYEDHLAGRTIGEVFGRAAAFLDRAAAKAASAAEAAQLAAG
jgi:hypothetical protein